MRGLIGTRPDIDRAPVDETALEIERPVMRSPSFHDQIDGFPQTFDGLGWVGISGIYLIGNAAHESRFEPALRNTIDHRHFFRDPDRIAAIGDRVAEDADAALLGLPRKDGSGER